MNLQVIPGRTQLLDIPSAALQAGYTTRDFRKIIKEDGIPMLTIGQKNFIIARDFEQWNSTHGEARFNECIKQLDRLLQEAAMHQPESLASFFDDED
jgi:hypothetical protein